MNKELLDALRRSGLLVVADHSARPDEGATVGRTLHCVAKKTFRSKIEAAGFVW
jgi:predicted methyltransferase